MPATLLQELNDLHDGYVVAINIAVEQSDLARADELVGRYEDDAIVLMAEREGKTHLLPIKRGTTPDSSLRRLVNRFRTASAA